MRKLITFILGNLLLAGLFLLLLFKAGHAADAQIWEFLGIPGNHTYDFYDYTYPGPSYASADFIYGNYSQASMITMAGSSGYGEVYSEFVTINTATYPYLKIKVDAVLNTATSWAIGVCTFDPDNWLGNMSFSPMAEPNTSTGYYCWDYNSAFASPGVHHFVVQIYVTGVLIGEDYYGYDGDYITVDYVRISDDQAEPTPGPTPTPGHRRKHGLGSWNPWLQRGIGGGFWGNRPLGFGYPTDDGGGGRK